MLFRFFDIVKPWPIREADHSLAGGLGIMLDDIIAGIFAAAILLAVQRHPLTAASNSQQLIVNPRAV